MVAIFSPEELQPELFVGAHELGARRPPYRRTFRYPGGYINEEQRWWSHCPAHGIRVGVRPDPRSDPGSIDDPQYDPRDVFGSLQRPDALKLYEMAYFCPGDIVELGTAYGLSTSIMAQALETAGAPGRIDTVDLNGEAQALAARALARLPGHARVSFHVAEGAEFLRGYVGNGRRAHFAFIDHAHTYDAVRAAAELMPEVLVPGGFVLFHDYNDARNSSPEDPAYADYWSKVPRHRREEYAAFGVYPAVQDALGARFEFYGCFGCTALFRKPG